MSDETYTNDGATEFEMVYEIPEDADGDYTVWLENEDEKVGVELAEFRAEWTECNYDFYVSQETNETRDRTMQARQSRVEEKVRSEFHA